MSSHFVPVGEALETPVLTQILFLLVKATAFPFLPTSSYTGNSSLEIGATGIQSKSSFVGGVQISPSSSL
jgi:hypothetical protein